jgi:hypothetical protein
VKLREGWAKARKRSEVMWGRDGEEKRRRAGQRRAETRRDEKRRTNVLRRLGGDEERKDCGSA